MDFHHQWRVLDDFASLKMPFKDYFYRASYGWFYLLIQSIPYLILRRTFFALLAVRHLYLPLVALVLSCLIARNVLRKPPLIIIFLFFCLLFRVNYIYESPRHLVAELSLSFFILYFLESRTKYLLISGLIAGLAVLTSFEYGAALNLAIFLLFISSFFSEVKLVKPFFNRFLLGEMAILVPFFSWLSIKGVFHNFWEYTFPHMANFYYTSPCSNSSFPRLSEIQNLTASSKLLIFGIPIEFLQRLNLYLVFVFFILYALVLLFLFLKNRKFSRDNLVRLALIIYGLLVFVRTLDTPCLGYFSYGLVPFFLLLTLLIETIYTWIKQKKPLGLKALGIVALVIIFSWFILTEHTGSLIRAFGEKEELGEGETFAREFYPPVGWFIKEDFAKDYQEIDNYIQDHTAKEEFLYVYPWGPYNHLAKRQSPSSYPLPVNLDGEKIVKEFQVKKPKLVVVNLYNNLGIAHYGKARGDVARYYSLGDEDGPVFAGDGDAIQEYILENYEPVLKNDLAVVMKPREQPIEVPTRTREVNSIQEWDSKNIRTAYMWFTGDKNKYEVIAKNASWALNFPEPLTVSDIEVEFKVNGNFITKHLARYFLNLCLITAEPGEETYCFKKLATRNWQVEKISLPEIREIKKLKIDMLENTGLIWWLHPKYLEIKKITLYQFVRIKTPER